MRAKLPALNARREAIIIALAAAEVSWVAAGFLALGKSASRHQPLLLWLGLLALLLGFSYIYRALDKANVSLRLRQGLLLVALSLSVILLFRFHLYANAELRGLDWFLEPLRQFADLSAAIADDVIAVFTLIYLWARGIHLARRSLSVEAVGFSFRAGVIIFMWVALPAKLFTDTDVSGFIPPYFFFSLVAVALSRVESVSREPSSRRASGSGFWISSAVVAVALVVVLGSAVAAFFSGGGLAQVLRLFSPLLVLLGIIIVILASLVFGLLELVFSLFSIDLSNFREMLQEVLRGIQVTERPVPDEMAEQVSRPEVLGAIQAGVILATVVGLVVLVLLFTWWRVRQDRDDELDGSRESLLSAGAIAQSLLDVLRSGRDRLNQMAGLVDRFGLGPRLLSAISIQRIYANLVRLATRAGYPRVKAQTPYEYLAVLNEAWPESAADVAFITEAYVSAHYGQVPDTGKELQRIRECWERVRARETYS